MEADPKDRPIFYAALDERNAKIKAWGEAVLTRYKGEVAAEQADMKLNSQRAWWTARDAWRLGHLACTWHCLLYTLAVFLMAHWCLGWCAYPIIFLTHWPVDRFRLARRYMESAGQKAFATGPLAPWSVVVVDNIFHLVVLYVLGMATMKGILP